MDNIFKSAPCKYFAENNEISEKIVLLILNQPLENFSTFSSLWNRAVLRVAVDGGANVLHRHCSENDNLDNFIPDMITGDFDSITPEVMQFYKNKETKIVYTPDQDETDFTKSIREVAKYTAKQNIKINTVLTAVTLTGRCDHIFGLFNTLFQAKNLIHVPVYIVSHDSITWVLWPGKHEISIPQDALQSSCGLIPLGMPASKVKTAGLKWNLDNQNMQFGGLISTSNIIINESVIIETDSPLVWTMGRSS